MAIGLGGFSPAPGCLASFRARGENGGDADGRPIGAAPRRSAATPDAGDRRRRGGGRERAPARRGGAPPRRAGGGNGAEPGRARPHHPGARVPSGAQAREALLRRDPGGRFRELPPGRPAGDRRRRLRGPCLRHADGARASRPRPRRQPRRRRRRLAKHREPRRGARPRGAPRRRARDHRDGAVRVARDERSPAISRGAGIGEGIERAAAAMTSTTPSDAALRRTVAAVALLNLAYFGVEFSVALAIGSVSLFADSVDFLEDASINLLILMALGWSAGTRARVGMALAAILLVPGLATLWTAWQKFSVPVPPAPLPLSLAGAGALAVNLTCALLLARFRREAGSLSRAAFLSARNDAFANVAIVAAGLVTAATLSAWPDLIVGLAIAAMNAGAAREVFAEARREHAAAAEP